MRVLIVFSLMVTQSAGMCAGVSQGLKALNDGAYEEAYRILTEEARKNNSMAQFFLGVMYDKGQFVDKSDDSALMWYRKAADQGDANAQYMAASKIYQVERYANLKSLAIDYLHAAAVKGNQDAVMKIALILRDGDGIERDVVGAAKLFKVLTEKGNRHAQFYLAGMYKEGLGVIQDYYESERLYKASISKDDVSSMIALAVLYGDGRSPLRNIEKSYMWFIIAASYGDQTAYIGRDKVVAYMTYEQILKMQRAARECNESDFQKC